MITCPHCRAVVQPDWDWCHACGWDPEGLRPAGWAPTAPAGPAAAGPPPAPSWATAPPASTPDRTAPPPPLAPGIPGGPGSAHAGYGPAPLRPAPPTGSSSGRTVLLVLLGCGAGFVGLVLVLILAVTFLGTSSTSRFSAIDVAIDDEPRPPPAGAITPGPIPELEPGLTDANGEPVPTEWVRYTAPDGSYSIEFPIEPRVIPVPLNQPTIERAEEVIARTDAADYDLLMVDYKPEYPINDPTQGLDFFVTNALPATGITITGTEPGTFAYSTSLSFTGVNNQLAGRTIQGVAFIGGDRLYVLMVDAPRTGAPEADRFFSSLTLG